MAVQDHPLYDDWSAALDALKEANDNLREAQKRRRSKAMIDGFAITVAMALADYQEISDKLDP